MVMSKKVNELFEARTNCNPIFTLGSACQTRQTDLNLKIGPAWFVLISNLEYLKLRESIEMYKFKLLWQYRPCKRAFSFVVATNFGVTYIVTTYGISLIVATYGIPWEVWWRGCCCVVHSLCYVHSVYIQWLWRRYFQIGYYGHLEMYAVTFSCGEEATGITRYLTGCVQSFQYLIILSARSCTNIATYRIFILYVLLNSYFLKGVSKVVWFLFI